MGGKNDEHLKLVFDKPVEGKLPEGSNGIVLASRPAFDARIVDAIFNSFGEMSDAEIVGIDDGEPFVIQINNPSGIGINKYKPFFYNRRNEYGRKHAYFEALSHATSPTSGKERFGFIRSSSARYSTRTEEAIEGVMCPATAEVYALVDAVKTINAEFFASLKQSLLSAKEGETTFSEELAEAFVDGALRNVAIQLHFEEPSLSSEQTLHFDHINSSLHMAVTINGTREIAFYQDENHSFKMQLKKGDVYLTSPAAIMHGVGVPKLSEAERSVAIQFRGLLDVQYANLLRCNKERQSLLFKVISSELAKFAGKFRVPTYEEWLAQLESVRREANDFFKIDPTLDYNPPKVEYKNVFIPTIFDRKQEITTYRYESK